MKADSPAQQFPVAPMQRGAWLTLLLIPLAAALAGLLPSSSSNPALPIPAWIAAPLITTLLLVPVALMLRRQRIALRAGTLEVASTLYTRKTALQDIDLDKARVVDLAEHTEFKPRLKANGVGLIGFQSGHFRLRNGNKAFCLVSDVHRVLVLPLRDGKSTLMLSPQKPQALLDALRTAHSAQASRPAARLR